MITVHFKDGAEMDFPGGVEWKWTSGRLNILNTAGQLIGQVDQSDFSAVRLAQQPVDIKQITDDLEQLKAGLEQ